MASPPVVVLAPIFGNLLVFVVEGPTEYHFQLQEAVNKGLITELSVEIQEEKKQDLKTAIRQLKKNIFWCCFLLKPPLPLFVIFNVLFFFYKLGHKRLEKNNREKKIK